MIVISRLRLDHAPALLAFEQENRAYFAASVPDRGDDYFAHFDVRHHGLLAEQRAGLHHFHLVEDGEGTVLGRVNLIDVAEGSAELGYRIAERAAGHGLATSAVRRVCALAAADYGLTRLRAATTVDNAASHAVLTRTGFEPTGEAVFDGRPGRLYTLGLSAPLH
ncbi:GNAT family N-acetyltransferase [Streptomyces sp. BE308]|uniref:GNAT family N-acetyltransferase n=1 Tax=unclassified Streptomyces TaxID=2593676 RepID=UPI002E7A797E|nr:GNAT family N-acetyltransferase [Streptomyces sp. BE308]MEE1795583.1 GNAT family N-acetyltransferase [Streptomyces sp. BE308]